MDYREAHGALVGSPGGSLSSLGVVSECRCERGRHVQGNGTPARSEIPAWDTRHLL